MQTKKQSFIESTVNMVVGLVLAMATTQTLAYLIPGMNISFSQNSLLTFVLTCLSVVRGYGCRRLFNWIHTKGQNLTSKQKVKI